MPILVQHFQVQPLSHFLMYQPMILLTDLWPWKWYSWQCPQILQSYLSFPHALSPFPNYCFTTIAWHTHAFEGSRQMPKIYFTPSNLSRWPKAHQGNKHQQHILQLTKIDWPLLDMLNIGALTCGSIRLPAWFSLEVKSTSSWRDGAGAVFERVTARWLL